MIYKLAYWLMLISYFILSIQGGTLKMKIIGFLLTVVNGLLFYK